MIAALAIPSAALAQDPAADQYSPTSSSGAGNVSTFEDGTPGGGSTPDPTGTAAPAIENDLTAPADNSTGTATGGPTGGGKIAQSSVDKPAAGASESSEANSAGADSRPQPDAELLRADDASGSGMGLFLWIVLGGTLLWAIALGVPKFRNWRNGGNGGPRRDSTSAASGDGRNDQPA